MPIAPVLILSADTDTQDLYVTVLRSRRRPVYGISNADEALALADVRPGAIVVDIRCEQDWDQIDRLHHSPMRRVPLVVVAGYVVRDDRFRRRAASAGCAACLAKPSPPDAVERTIDRAMRGEQGVDSIATIGVERD